MLAFSGQYSINHEQLTNNKTSGQIAIELMPSFQALQHVQDSIK